MLKCIGALFDRICAVVCAIVFAQIPLFLQQYIQQLTGREAELRRQVEAMRHAAKHTGKTLEQFVQKFVTNSDVDIASQGDLMQSLVHRWHQFADALSALQNSSAGERPFIFLAHLNVDTFKSTAQHFSLGLPLTIEGAVYALIGVAFGYLVFSSLRKLWRGFVALCAKPFKKLNPMKSN